MTKPADNAAPQKPSNGRIVEYMENVEGKLVGQVGLVVFVHNETSVNLVVWNANGVSRPKRSVSYDAAGASGTWRWPARV